MADDEHHVPVRRGAQKLLTLDFDAARLLEELASGSKCQGRLVSELVRTKVSRREERQRRREADAGCVCRGGKRCVDRNSNGPGCPRPQPSTMCRAGARTLERLASMIHRTRCKTQPPSAPAQADGTTQPPAPDTPPGPAPECCPRCGATDTPTLCLAPARMPARPRVPTAGDFYVGCRSWPPQRGWRIVGRPAQGHAGAPSEPGTVEPAPGPWRCAGGPQGYGRSVRRIEALKAATEVTNTKPQGGTPRVTCLPV